MARSIQSRFLDNIGRRIRHINADLKKNPDEFRKAGLERQKEKLEIFRDKVKKEAAKNPNGKLTPEQFYEAVDEFETNDNLTTDKKKIDQITRKMISEEPEEFFDQFKDVNLDDLFADYARISERYIGESGDTTLRSKANDLIGKINVYTEMGFLDENQISQLNKLAKSIEDAYYSKGYSGVVYPIGKKEDA